MRAARHRDLAPLAAALGSAHGGERRNSLLDVGAEGVEGGDDGKRVLRKVRPRCADAVGNAPATDVNGDVRPVGIERPHFRVDVGVFMTAEGDDAGAMLAGAPLQAGRSGRCRG